MYGNPHSFCYGGLENIRLVWDESEVSVCELEFIHTQSVYVCISYCMCYVGTHTYTYINHDYKFPPHMFSEKLKSVLLIEIMNALEKV